MSDAITVEEVKVALNYPLDINDKDAQIEKFIKTALAAVSDYIDRPLSDPRCRDKEDPLLIAYPLIHAALLMVGDFMDNLAAQQETALNINITCQNLMNPYRKLGV